MSKRKSRAAALPKTDVRYWQRTIFLPTYTRDGVRCVARQFCAKLQHAGRRETIPLDTANRAAAAAKARDFYIALKAGGWDVALKKFQIAGRKPTGCVATVGEFVAAVQTIWSGNQKTLGDYIRAFRMIVADVAEIESGVEKFDYRSGGRKKWLEKIGTVRLREISPERIQKWKVSFLARAGADHIKKRAAVNSVNSLLRQAKSLFSAEILKFVKMELGSPFEGVRLEPRPSARYQSKINIADLIRAAEAELPREQFKVFLLGAMAGLRRNEIDKLEWTAFDWQRGLISISATSVFAPKSEDSVGDVEIDPEVMERFRTYFATATGSFVIESGVPAKLGVSYSHYRCDKTFVELTKWLRRHGVSGPRPLHTLRKEFGSQICAEHGLYAASRALRHADIAITAQFYVDKRQRTVAGLGRFLTKADNITPLPPLTTHEAKKVASSAQ